MLQNVKTFSDHSIGSNFSQFINLNVTAFLAMLSFHILLFISVILYSVISCHPIQNHKDQTRKSRKTRNEYEHVCDNSGMPILVSTAPADSFLAIETSHSESNSSFSDYKVSNYPELFASIMKYELLRAFGCRTVNFVQNINILRSYAPTKQVQNKCYTGTHYKYVKCSDPLRGEYSFRYKKGDCACMSEIRHNQRQKENMRNKNECAHRKFYLRKTLVTFCKRLKPGRKFGYSAKHSGTKRPSLYDRPCCCKNGVCYEPHSGGYGHKLRAIVSEFVLTGKLEWYRRQIEVTFGLIRHRYQGNRYSIGKNEHERNGKVYVQYYLSRNH